MQVTREKTICRAIAGIDKALKQNRHKPTVVNDAPFYHEVSTVQVSSTSIAHLSGSGRFRFWR
jgi:hypothetical protein